MQLFKKTVDAVKKYEFFKGSNIFDKMKSSTFGIFHNNINKMDIPIDDFKLPIITIIGNESSGKSSLISNILKCDIFPINKKRCTKCPIKIELVNSQTEKYQITFKGEIIDIKNKEDILDNVTKIMTNIDDIIDDELHIIFSNSYVITSTYYDLPGIIEYPDNLRQKSKAIVNKYIIQENTLIICVIPASTPRLTSNQALGLIIDAKKTKDCIIALSMVDLLHDDDMETFINRIIMKSDEINNLNIHNIIGLSNNKKIDENKWFADNILTYINDKIIEEEIISKITIDNLLKSVDVMYDNFIKLNWKNKAITTADNKILKLEKEYEEFGKENLEIIDVYNYIKDKINLKDILDDILYKNKGTLYLNDKYLSPKFQEVVIFDSKIFNDTNIEDIEYEAYSYEEEYKNITNDIELVIKNYNNKKNLINEVIIATLEIVFNEEYYDEFKLKRFTSLKNYIKNNYIKIIKNEIKGIDEWFNKSIENFKYDLYSKKDLAQLEEKSHINFMRYILTNLMDMKIEDQSLLIENDEFILKRTYLKEEINKYNNCKTIIANL
jgi:hypothetical protein